MIFKKVLGGAFLLTAILGTSAHADFTVVESNGKIWLSADSGNNRISVRSVWLGWKSVIRVTGHDNTEIDGEDVIDLPFPIGDIIIDAPWSNSGGGTTEVTLHNIYGLSGNVELRNVEEVNINTVWTSGDIILGCPVHVSIYNAYVRDIRSIHDYAANSISVLYSETTRNLSLYGRNIDLYDVEIGGSGYFYGTGVSDDHVLNRVTGRTYSQKPTIKAWLRSGNDYMTLDRCRVNFLYTHGSYGTDTLYINNRNNSISSSQRVSIEWVK